jgi:hypothetical protein
LNRRTFRLAQLVGGGELDWNELRAAVLHGARALGLPRDEAERTVASAMNAGFSYPRSRR